MKDYHIDPRKLTAKEMEELGVEGNEVTLKGYTFNKTVKTGTSKSTYKPPPE